MSQSISQSDSIIQPESNREVTIPTRNDDMEARIEAALRQHEKRCTKSIAVDVAADADLHLGSVYMRGTLVLTEPANGKQFRFYGEMLNEINIGRADTVAKHQPDVDLSAVGGKQQGVSRSHAGIMRRDDVLVIVDHNSTNGTYLNGKRLVPGVARVVRDGDVLHISSLRLDVTYTEN